MPSISCLNAQAIEATTRRNVSLAGTNCPPCESARCAEYADRQTFVEWATETVPVVSGAIIKKVRQVK